MVWRKWSRIRRANFLWEITFNKIKLMFSVVKLNDNWYNHSNFYTMIGPSNLFRMSKVSFKINLLMLPKRIVSVKDVCVKDDGLSFITFLFLNKIIFCANFFLSVLSFTNIHIHDSQDIRGRRSLFLLTALYRFQPFHRQLEISWVINTEISPLRIDNSQAQTGNLWFLSVSCYIVGTFLPSPLWRGNWVLQIWE